MVEKITNKEYPRKTRELCNRRIDSTIWNDFKFRDDDIIIASYGKSGTTWLQQIVSQLIFKGEEEIKINELSPWLESRLPPKELKFQMLEAQTHRRFIKTHLAANALVFSTKAKYIFIARDGRDVALSFYNHLSSSNELYYQTINNMPGYEYLPPESPPLDINIFFNNWLEKDGYPLWPFWKHIKSWWIIRDLPNVKFLHFKNLKKNTHEEIREIAKFLDISVDEAKWESIFSHCKFEYMKKNADKIVPLGGITLKGGAQTFMHKGIDKRWLYILTDEENRLYEMTAIEKLGKKCAHWLMTGEL